MAALTRQSSSGRRPRRGAQPLAGLGAWSPACSQALADELGLEPRDGLGRRWRRLREPAAAEVDRVVEVAGQPERAGAAQRELAALRGRGGALDRLAQQDGSVGLHVSGERQPELDSARPRRRPASSGGSASARRRKTAALSGAPRAVARSAAARSAATVAGVGAGFGVQQVQRDVARGRRARAPSSRAARACQSARSPGPRLAYSAPATSGCASASSPSPSSSPARAQRVREPRRGRRLEPGERAPRAAAARRGRGRRTRARARRRRRAAARAGARRCARPARARTRSAPPRPRRSVRRRSATRWASERAEQERVAAGDGVAGVREPRRRPPAAARARAPRRRPGRAAAGARAARRRRQQLGEQLRLGRPARRRARRTARRARSSSSRRASWASQRSDGASAQWTSSTTSTRRAALGQVAGQPHQPVAQRRAWRRRRGAGSGASGSSARRASPAAPTVELVPVRPARTGANSCRIILGGIMTFQKQMKAWILKTQSWKQNVC